MRVFDFNRAIVRRPGRSAVNGLRSQPSDDPDYDTLVAEHAAYIDALSRAGLAVDILPALEAFPDSMFVEDPAIVMSEGAVLLRPGAPSRRGEVAEMREPLARHFAHLTELVEGLADGGDVLMTPEIIYIGLSARTDRTGAESLRIGLGTLGRKARIAETPKGVLHFKTAVSLLSEEVVFATPAMAAADIFNDLDTIVTPDGEEAAANALRVNDTVLIGAEYPRSAELLTKKGFTVATLSVRETAKLDAGLSCMSLRWWAA